MIRFQGSEFLSRILVKSRRQYRFTGIVVGRLCIGFFWPVKKGLPAEPKNQLEFKLEAANQ